jgi:recombination protein RecT
MANEKQTANGTKAVQKYENISERVLSRIEEFQKAGGMVLPKDYSVENHMKSAWLILQSTTDRSGQQALAVCTKESIANALLDMVLQGLAVSKKQGYFIVYGNKLEFQRSYFGTIALAKRTGGIKNEPVANVIYEGDEFVYAIDPKTARISIVKHEQKIENIDNTKIKGAYALVTLADGTTQVTIMSMAQIRAAWGQGATKGNSPAHKNFAEEMAKKTVIGRACKAIINSSDDAWLYDGKSDELETDNATRQREVTANTEKRVVVDAESYEEVETTTAPASPTTELPRAAAQTTEVPTADADDEPGY